MSSLISVPNKGFAKRKEFMHNRGEKCTQKILETGGVLLKI